MRPVSGNGRRSFLQKHFYYQTHITQTNFQICTLLSYLSLFLIFTCYPAAPQGRKRKGANCAARVCGGSWELGEILLPSCSFSDCCHFLPFCLCLSLLVLSCILYCLALPGSFLVFPVRCLFLPAGIACSCRLLLFLV